MNASELNRKLLYCGLSDLTDYLRNSPLNRYLYKQFLDYKEMSSFDTPILALFNELYYQCVRVGFDSNPGENLRVRYLKESEYWLKSKQAAEIVFCYVWVLFKRKRKLTFNEECFIEHLNPIVLHSENKEMLEDMYMDMENKDIKVPDQFAPMHYPVSGIPIQTVQEHNSIFRRVERFLNRLFQPSDVYVPSGNSWLSLTDNYSHALIERYVKLYSSVNDRLALLDHIEHSCTRRQHKRHEDFFLGLRAHINSGQVVYRVIRDGETPTDWVETGMIGAQEFINPYTNELQNIAEQYKQERDEARQQKDEQQKAFELEITRMQAKYESDIAELKQKKQGKTNFVFVFDEEGKDTETEKKNLSLTIPEIAKLVKDRFSKDGAMEVSTLLYHLAIERGCLEEELFRIIDGIVPAVIERDKPQQHVDITTAHQVNIGQHTVVNHEREDVKKD